MVKAVSVEGPRVIEVSLVRVRRPTEAQAGALSARFGAPWPTTPNTISCAGAATIAWLGPGEWAVLGMEAAGVERGAAEALGEALHLVADVTDGRSLFTIAGPLARDLLAKGCSLDLHGRRFGPGACAQTLLGQCDVLITRRGADDAFEVLVDATLAAHLSAWFADAALEFAP